MKTTLLFTICFFIGLGCASADDIDARLVHYSGQIPSDSVLVRSVDSGAIATSKTFSAKIASNNSFSYDAIKQVEYPTDYDADGKPDATEKRNTGITFTGSAILSEGTYNLDFKFHLNELKTTLFCPLEKQNGIIVAQPVFREKELKTKTAVKLNNWVLFPLADEEDGSHVVMLLRIHK